ncbi:MAG: hypothetical protein ACT4N2_01350 [Hyphomicrobium sp.]
MQSKCFTAGAAALAWASCVVAAPQTASAQALSPMRGEIRSFSEQFAVRVFPMNPYPRRMQVQVRVYDETFRPVAATVLPSEAMIGPQDSRSVMVIVPFDGKPERRVRICAESIPMQTETSRLRTQVCGKFLAHRLQ